jgi:DNA-binding XRE family transcriptional regulator
MAMRCLLVVRAPGCAITCGATSLSDAYIVQYRLDFVYISSKILYKLANIDRRRRMLTVVKIDGHKVRTARERRFLSQRELADKAGINHNTIWRVEGAGLTEVHPRTIRKIAEALSVDPATLTPEE